MMNRILGRPPPPEEMVRKWRQSIRAQERTLDRQIRGIESEEVKIKRSMKQLAKKKDITNCKMLAKELVRSRKQKDRIHTSKAQLNSILMQLQQQLATLKVAGSLQKSTEVMTLVNRLVKLPEISQTMETMAMEMTKAGIMEEMIGDTLDAFEDEDIEEEADEEVNKVLFQVTEGLLGEATPVGAPLQSEAEPEEEPELDEMQARLSALRA
ncbi:charged multivesicular body protein 3 [Basidiobolus meristosporus CBS 931.73]|uniref:Charged multivesicular body protein 3 n=1 Tax=Basidiobolus meristosporus CBS 931.73 TaxID=1314790 RepID=A0A1Y1Z736_9FUNG|nr:charged multivesicular body protein 3 [Basidiobolus meristosporus CBS 931.73]|eukprot:ORY06071.1 charged multivesicular body protein 3 [Basidiobolus meristosporus CBS 931.73]